MNEQASVRGDIPFFLYTCSTLSHCQIDLSPIISSQDLFLSTWEGQYPPNKLCP